MHPHPSTAGRVFSLVAGLLLAIAAGAPAAPAPDRPPIPEGDGPWVVRATFADRSQVDRLAAEIPPWEVHHDRKYVVVDVDREGYRLLLDLGFEPAVDWILTQAMLQPRKALPGQVTAIPGYPCYRTVEETYAAAQAIVTAHPGLAPWIDIGDTRIKVQNPALGYDLRVLKLTSGLIAPPKPALFVMASVHAREYTPAELVTRFAEYLASGYGNDADATWILDHHEVHLLLQANPDGRKRAETGLLWRKNSDNNFCSNLNSRGIDLNRNYLYKWGCCLGSSGSPCNETFRGPGAGSEPETQAVQNYVRSIFPDYGDPAAGAIPSTASGLFIDVHSYSELVLWQYGWTAGPSPNDAAYVTLGRKAAWFNHYTPEQASDLYITDGTTDDFAYGDLGVAALAVELGTSFFQDCATFQNTIYPDNLQMLIYAARVARTPYQLPAGPDALSPAAVPNAPLSGQTVNLSATIDDTRYENSNGTQPTQNLAAAEVYVDTPPWMPGALPQAMAAADGAFDEKVEAVQAAVPTAGWPTGRHTLFVRGRDVAGDWGPVSAVFVDVQVPVELQSFAIE